MIIAENFLKDLPLSKKDFVLKKLETFDKLIKESSYFFQVPKGFWIRRVVGTDIYKFRVNSGDRILFTVHHNRGEDNVVFLRYCNHDEQINKAHQLDKTLTDIKTIDFDIDTEEYIEDEMDQHISHNYSEYLQENAVVDVEKLVGIVLEDEYIALLLDENNDDYMYYLNDEQYQCLQVFGRPLLITGSAGSGKTMIGIHKLILNNKSKIQSAYVTYSNLLKEKSKEYFNKYKDHEEDNVEFFTINEFCLNKLDISRDKLIGYKEFELWCTSNNYIKNILKNLNIVSIWSEISGIIKGFKGEDWINGSNTIMDENEYLGTRHSSVDRELRIKIYAIALQYEKWLREKGLFDENDIATMCFEKLHKEESEKFDFIVVDEIQDMNESQIVLIYNLVKNKNNILITGDPNQIINHTFFDFGRIKKLFYINNKEVNERSLHKNYRSVSGIVELANEMVNIRKSLIGNRPYDWKESYIRDGKKPFIIKFNQENKKALFEAMSNKDYCAIVVGNTEEKNRLQIEGYDISRVFTVNEIKGLEYKSILCINLVSKYEGDWNYILNGYAKKDDSYRYFFNQFYVASTRARDILCFIEEAEDLQLYKNLNQHFTLIKEWDPIELELEAESSIHDWLKEAKKLELAEKYNQAYDAYKRANNHEGQERCKEKIKDYELEFWSNILGIEKETAIRIENNGQPLTEEIILNSLYKICKDHNVFIDSEISVVVQCEKGGAYVLEDNIEGNDRLKSLSRISQKLIEKNKDIIPVKLTLHVKLLKDNWYVALTDDKGEIVDTIIVVYENSNHMSISYSKTKQDSIDAHLDALNPRRQELGSLFSDDMIIDENIRKYALDAAIMFQKGNIEEAFNGYKKALELVKDENYTLKSSIISDMGNCFLKYNDLDNAAKLYTLAIEYNENNVEPYNNLGVVHLNLGNYHKAIELFEKALDLYPNYIEAKNNLRLAKSLMQQFKEDDQDVGSENTKKTKIGRNDPCPCGSGKKYKKCCGNPV